jgi:hypothetical protein
MSTVTAEGAACNVQPSLMPSQGFGAIHWPPHRRRQAFTLDGNWYGTWWSPAFLCLLLLIRWAVDRALEQRNPVALMLTSNVVVPYATTYFAHVRTAASSPRSPGTRDRHATPRAVEPESPRVSPSEPPL